MLGDLAIKTGSWEHWNPMRVCRLARHQPYSVGRPKPTSCRIHKSPLRGGFRGEHSLQIPRNDGIWAPLEGSLWGEVLPRVEGFRMVRHRRLHRLGICIPLKQEATASSPRGRGEIPMRVDRLTCASTNEAQVSPLPPKIEAAAERSTSRVRTEKPGR